MKSSEENLRSGSVVFVGRPNVGKSSLINRLLGRDVAAVTPKPNTTQQPLNMTATLDQTQWLLVDTPGEVLQATKSASVAKASGKTNSTGLSDWLDADLVVFVIRGQQWTKAEDHWLKRLQERQGPILLVINQIDRIKQKSELLPWIKTLNGKHDFVAIIPLSATRGTNVDALQEQLNTQLPAQSVTTLPEIDKTSHRLTELIECLREQLLWQLHDEIPYTTQVNVLQIEQKPDQWLVDAEFVVARDRHRGIIIGRGGQQLKNIGMKARKKLEKLWNKPVVVRLTVVTGGRDQKS
ncbi:MAG: GTPase Era [Gammaproteobacteria bacterium]|nr:GTPase Era [Gammaproteobacteria bacterium]